LIRLLISITDSNSVTNCHRFIQS